MNSHPVLIIRSSERNNQVMNKLLLAMVLSLGLPLLGQVPQPASVPQPRFEDTLSKAVLRITFQAAGLDGEMNGTGFLVEVPEKR